MLVGMANKSAKVHIQVCGSLKTQQNQGPRAKDKTNMHTTQILVHTFSHNTLDSVVS